MDRDQLIERYEAGPAEVRAALDGITPRRARPAARARRLDHSRGRPPPGRLGDQQLRAPPPAAGRRRRADRRLRRGGVGARAWPTTGRSSPRSPSSRRCGPPRPSCCAPSTTTPSPARASTPRAATTASPPGSPSTPTTPMSTPTRSAEHAKGGPDARPPLPRPWPPSSARRRRHHVDHEHRRRRTGRLAVLLRSPRPLPIPAARRYRRQPCGSSTRLTTSSTLQLWR